MKIIIGLKYLGDKLMNLQKFPRVEMQLVYLPRAFLSFHVSVKFVTPIFGSKVLGSIMSGKKI